MRTLRTVGGQLPNALHLVAILLKLLLAEKRPAYLTVPFVPMKFCRTLALLMTAAASLGGAEQKAPMVSLPIAPVANADAAPEFNPALIATVSTGIKELVPSCPPAALSASAKSFLNELRDRRPDQVDQLAGAGFKARDFESSLLRCVALNLPESGFEPLREELARRRAKIIYLRAGSAATIADDKIEAMLKKIKALSDVRYRTVLDGRMPDEDLAFYLKRADDSKPARAETTAPGGLSARDIVTEYGRRNQTGGALQRWKAYTIEGRVKAATGETQFLSLAKMRPENFRLAVSVGGTTRFVQAGDGTRFWQQVPGGPVQTLSREKMGSRRYLAEFIDPLLAADGYAFDRLEDGGSGAGKFYRISVSRPDGTKYVSHIDEKTYRQVGLEQSDGSTVKFSDFREIAGVTFAFKEEVTDRGGQKGTLELTRVTPNPGLVQAFFEPSPQGEQGFFEFERMLARAKPAESASTR